MPTYKAYVIFPWNPRLPVISYHAHSVRPSICLGSFVCFVRALLRGRKMLMAQKVNP